MQNVLAIVDAVTAPITQTDAQQTAQAYLCQRFGSAFHPNRGVWTQRTWRFLIHYQTTNEPRPLVVGRLDVDAETGQVIPLTAHEIGLLQERLAILLMDLHGAPAQDRAGNIHPAVARRNVKGYLGQYISIFAQPAAAVHWSAGDPPTWRVPVIWSQPGGSPPCTLGTILVNAQTGAVIPLTEQQQQAMQRCIQDAAPCSPHPATTAS
jgi:hypothetical protein